MSRLTNFEGKPKIVEYEGETFNVYPLKNKHQSLLSNLGKGTEEEKNNNLLEIFQNSLRDETNLTFEDIDNMPLELGVKINRAIMSVNGLEKEE